MVGLITKLLAGNIREYEWKSEDMIILTNGLCGSACASISQRMAEVFNVTTVGVGGLKDTSMSYASFPGGQVFEFDDLISVLSDIGLWQNDTSLKDLIPPPFLTANLFSFTIREAYGLSDDDALEYTYKSAKHRLYYNEQSARDPSILWAQAAELLS